MIISGVDVGGKGVSVGIEVAVGSGLGVSVGSGKGVSVGGGVIVGSGKEVLVGGTGVGKGVFVACWATTCDSGADVDVDDGAHAANNTTSVAHRISLCIIEWYCRIGYGGCSCRCISLW